MCIAVALATYSADGNAQTKSGTQAVVVTPRGSQPSSTGSAHYFTGSVRVEPLFDAKASSCTSGAYVRFEPGARSAWHTHPRGQTLIVTAGVGRVQGWGEPVQEIRPGDVVWTPPGQKHWHGASPGSAMTHIAIQESLDGRAVQWLEHVTDAQYAQLPKGSLDAQASAAPALERYTNDAVLAGLWKRSGLSPRDRSIVTVAALIARNHLSEMPSHFGRALDNGVKPSELSEVITHLAFYAGWGNATAANAIAASAWINWHPRQGRSFR